MKLAWTHYGPPRSISIAVPRAPSRIDWYVLDYDETLEQLFYLGTPDDGRVGAEYHRFDGTSWNKLSRKRLVFEGGHLEGGGYDASRRAMVAWGHLRNREKKCERVCGAVISPKDVQRLATTGDEPLLEPHSGEALSPFAKRGLFAFDRARAVWVCLTRRGVWEIDAAGVWRCGQLDEKLVPQDWHGQTGEGVYDPVGKRTVFMMQSRAASYKMVVLAWDGRELRVLPRTGLPALTSGLSHAVAQIVSHAHHGLVLHAGAGALFAATKEGWKRLPATSAPPPMMQNAVLAYDPKRDLLVLGPGKHEGTGGSAYQDVFFVLRQGTWERQGAGVRYSPLAEAANGECRFAHVGGVWYAMGSRSLQTWKWTGVAWDEIVNRAEGQKRGDWQPGQVVGGDHLRAVLQSGAVFELDGKQRWTALGKPEPAFKERTEFALARDANGRLVVWGGEAKDRKLNDTLFFEGKRWRVAKKASPQPADFKHGRQDEVYVGTSAVYDTALGAVVRFGYEEVAVLQEDETWKLYKPKGYKANVSERLWGHAPIHDPETGETLLLDFAGALSAGGAFARLVRFDLASCVVLGTVDYPPELTPKRPSDAPSYYALAESFSYDPATRSLYAQVINDSWGVYRLDLGKAFAQAQALGPRTLPERAAARPQGPLGFAPVRLYRVTKGKVELVTCEGDAKKATAVSGLVGAKGTRKSMAVEAATALLAAKRKAGFVRADELSHPTLAELVGVTSQEITFGKAAAGKPPASRLGGLPAGITPASWPRVQRTPMGFLFQLETGGLLTKHAGVAVFCAVDGDATDEHSRGTVALLLKAADFKKTCPAPEGVAVLPMRPVRLKAEKTEIDDDRAQRLGAREPELAAAFERLRSMQGMQRQELATKLGGIPQFLQEVVPMPRFKFICQLDFDCISTPAWPDAGLMGCVYVFVSDDEKTARAFWQYT
jgi:hypothetical protein